MLKQKVFKVKLNRQALAAIFIALVLTCTGVFTAFAHADQYDEQIRALQNQNASNRSTSNQLAAQASDYQDAIDRLQAQINSLQAAIDENQNKIVDLQKQIDQAQAELNRQKQVLGADIKNMYIEGQVSTIEILASSNSLSDFIDQEQYRFSVQTKVRDTLAKITALKLQLQQQQEELKGRAKDMQNQQTSLSDNRAQQSQMLAYTTTQKTQYDQQIRSNNAQISALRAAQAAANQRLGGTVEAGDPNHGGYPGNWDRAPEDSLLDSWGMLNRECVSYTAWKVHEAYGYMPYWGGHGNANQWPASAAADGIATGTTPKANSVAISMGGYYGHAMWVEYVLDNGYIHVSQYNYDLAGHYSEMTINGAGLTYIYFGH